MTKKVTENLFDDLDHAQGVETPADETVHFGFDGQEFTVDLTTPHADEFRELLAPYLEVGTPTSTSRKVTVAKAPVEKKPSRVKKAAPPVKDSQLIRDWAREHSYQVGDRGRIPNEIMEAYQMDQGTSKPRSTEEHEHSELPYTTSNNMIDFTQSLS
jgi:Lsr2